LARKPTLDEMGARGEVPFGGSGRITGPAGLSPRSLARKNTLDEMTVARTEVPLAASKPLPSAGEDGRPRQPKAGRGGEGAGSEAQAGKPSSRPHPEVRAERASKDQAHLITRGKIGAGSYEEPGEERSRKGRPKKTGKPGR
jgi:excinuclease ABC subunit B